VIRSRVGQRKGWHNNCEKLIGERGENYKTLGRKYEINYTLPPAVHGKDLAPSGVPARFL